MIQYVPCVPEEARIDDFSNQSATRPARQFRKHRRTRTARPFVPSLSVAVGVMVLESNARTGPPVVIRLKRPR